MIHEAKSACYLTSRRLLRRRYRFIVGTVTCRRSLSRRAYVELALVQAEQPVAVLAGEDGRCYWWCHGRFWWEEENLAGEDVLALVLDRERRQERRLERAHAAMAGEQRPMFRPGIPRPVKQAVWESCGGRCTECGGDSLLEFDHIIPLAMGGSSRAGNLQLLCAECNREKGASL